MNNFEDLRKDLNDSKPRKERDAKRSFPFLKDYPVFCRFFQGTDIQEVTKTINNTTLGTPVEMRRYLLCEVKDLQDEQYKIWSVGPLLCKNIMTAWHEHTERAVKGNKRLTPMDLRVDKIGEGIRVEYRVIRIN